MRGETAGAGARGIRGQAGPRFGRLDLNQFVYDSKQGWSGSGEAAVTGGAAYLRFGLVSDGDGWPERYAGIRASYEDNRFGTDRLASNFHSKAITTNGTPAP